MAKVHDHLLALTQLEYKLNAMELELYSRYDHAAIFKKQAQRNLGMENNIETEERVAPFQKTTGANETTTNPEAEASQHPPPPSIDREHQNTDKQAPHLFAEPIGPSVPIAKPSSRRHRAPRKRPAKTISKEKTAPITDGVIPNRAEEIKPTHQEQPKTESLAVKSAIHSFSPPQIEEPKAQKSKPSPPRELLRSGLKREHKEVKSNPLHRHEVIRNKKPEPIPVPSEEELFGFFEDSDTLLLDNLSDLLSELPIEVIDQPNPIELGSELEHLTTELENDTQLDPSSEQPTTNSEAEAPKAPPPISEMVQTNIETLPQVEAEAETKVETAAETNRGDSSQPREEDQDRLLSDEVMLEILTPPPEPILHESIEALSDALDKDQQNSSLWLARAKLWKKRGDIAAGISDAYRATVLLPESVETQSLLDELLLVAKLPQYRDLLKRSK